MTTVLRLLFVASSIALGSAAAQPPDAPINLPTRAGDVRFSHKSHAKLACRECHATAAGGRIEALKNKDAAHGLCRGCHERVGQAFKCRDCHSK